MRLGLFPGNAARKVQSRIYPERERNEPKYLDNLKMPGFFKGEENAY
jgi:hypothetical protein